LFALHSHNELAADIGKMAGRGVLKGEREGREGEARGGRIGIFFFFAETKQKDER